jgi:hypothetical protein
MRGCVVLVILAFSSELLAQSISEHPIDCPVAIIQANQEQPQCVEDEVVEKNESTSKWDAEIYFSGLVSTQLNKPLAPISLWGMHVGIPMTKHVQTGVWIDNPVLGDNLPSKLIQPARSSYSLQVEVQNFHKNDNSGVRIVFTHTSDHTVEELLEHVNNGFDQRSSGGEINTLGVGKKILINKQNQNDITVGWIDIDGHVNISRLIEIPGYLLADLNSTGVMIKSRHQYKFGKNDRHKVNSTLAHVTNVKKKCRSNISCL